MNIEKELNEIVVLALANYPNVFHVATKQSGDLYEVIIDGDQLLGIYEISEISRLINQMADERMPEEKYSLEIASPGADSDLKLLRQYPKHVGRSFRVVLSGDNAFVGKLISVQSESLEFEPEQKNKKKNSDITAIQAVNYKDIKKANIILSFK